MYVREVNGLLRQPDRAEHGSAVKIAVLCAPDIHLSYEMLINVMVKSSTPIFN